MHCDDFRVIADSYLSDELLIETNHDVIRHLDSCANCRFELAGRRQLRHRLKIQFNESAALRIREGFAAGLKLQLRDQALGRPRIAIPRFAYVGVAASILIAVAVGILGLQSLRNSRRELLAWTNLTESAIGDHRECAVEHRLAPTIISLDEAGRTYDRAFANLASAVSSEGVLPAGAQLLDAHSCMFQGKRFAHFVVKYHDQIASVLVAKVDAPNSRAPRPEPGQLVKGFDANSYRIAFFQTSKHAGFVVSGMNEADNLAIARSVAPALEKQIRRAEENVEARAFKW